MNKTIKNNILLSISVVGAFGLGWFWGDIFQSDASIEKYTLEQKFTSNDKDKSLNKIEYIFDYVTKNHLYQDNLDKQQMWENAYSGLLKDIDGGLTQYIPPIKQENVEQQINGNYVGFGITIDKSNNGDTYIQNIDVNSKSAEKGLSNGDKIISINDIDVTKEDINKVSNIINNEQNVKVTVQRGNEIIEANLEKEVIKVPNVAHYQKIDNNTHYIKIDSFNDKAIEDINKIINDNFKLKQNKEKLIIDLRDNYGGTLESYENIINIFVDKNIKIYSKKTVNDKDDIFTKSNSIINFDKYIVLVNNNTASAAELMASNIKDILNGTVIGVNTYGKASIQSIIDLKDGSHLYITDKEYLTSKGKKVQGIGIKPDIEILDAIEQYNKAIEVIKN